MARVDEMVRFDRRDAETLAPMIAELALEPEVRSDALAMVARGDGAWTVQALRAEALIRQGGPG